MEANEIQIGDWVYSTFSKLPCKVTYLKLHESGCTSVETTNVVGVKDIASLKPIPLTPEILEKNGFEKWDDGWCIYDQENTGIEVAWAGTILKIGGECGNLELPAVMYVHQLQHALRFCGIDETIEL